jgi:hypothetical protein
VSADDLTGLLNSRRWVKRRVDRVEFLDLDTVRRTIVFTLDLSELAKVQGRFRERFNPRPIPLGWFVPWANAGAALRDADRRVIPYLTSEESDYEVQRQIGMRMSALKLERVEALEAIRKHRADAGQPGVECECCGAAVKDRLPGYSELMSDKWGCRATVRLLDELYRKENTASQSEARELAQVLLAWQTNFVLFARLDNSRAAGNWTTLELSYDEALDEWEPPWERRKRVLGTSDLCWCEARKCRKLISRGGPFHEDLNRLLPRCLDRTLARSRCRRLRRVGRRGMLGVAWHVAWHQASGLDVPSHQVDVILPSELTTVRMRMLRQRGATLVANVADQVGARATIVAPEVDGCGSRPLPTLFSLVITQRSPGSWYGGALLALLTGVVILATALWWLPDVGKEVDSAVTVLVVVPALGSALLSARAASEIAEQLTTSPRTLIGTVGVVAVICAIGLIVQGEHGSFATLTVLWVAAGGLLLCVAMVLFIGAWRIQRLIDFGRRRSPRKVAEPVVGEVLNPKGALRVPPPDRWLASGEGDLVPWGWLHAAPRTTQPRQPPVSTVDNCFWSSYCHDPLVGWVQKIIYHSDDPPET